MKSYLAIATFITSMILANPAFALIDFESAPGGGSPVDDAPIVGSYTDGSVTLTFGFDTDSNGSVESPAIFERAGTFPGEGTNIGFQGSDGTDTADSGFGGQLGNWFLRGGTFGTPFGRFVIQYSSSLPVTAASGEIWDIDGQLPNGTFNEQYRVEAFDSADNSLGTILSPIGTHTTLDPLAVLDGRPWVFSFSGLSASIDHIYITFIGTKPSGIGLAFNNFYPTTAVPEPAVFALAAFSGCALLSTRRRHAFMTV